MSSGHSGQPRGPLLLLVSVGCLGAVPHDAHASLVISDQPTQNVTCQHDNCIATAADATLNVNDLQNLTESTTYFSVLSGTADSIVVNAPFTAFGEFSLDASNSVVINARIDVGPSESSDDALYVCTSARCKKSAPILFGSAGRVVFHDPHKVLFINSKRYQVVSSITEMQVLAAKFPSVRMALAKDVSAKSATPYAGVVPGMFTGIFEGLGNTISNLALGGNGGATGLFAQLGLASPAVSASVADLRLNVKLATTDGSGGGALAGVSYNSTIRNVVVSGKVMATEPGANGQPLGGLVGTMSGGTMSNCANTAVVTVAGADPALAGGLVGAAGNGATIDSAFSTGGVSGVLNSSVGGLVGSANAATITNSFATGTVSVGAQGSAGGLIGTDSGSTLGWSYANATVGGTGSAAGALLGHEIGTGPAATDMYWDKTTAGALPAIGAGGNAAGMMGETTSELRAALPAGFNASIWTQTSGVNNGLPYLIALPPP